MRMNAADDVGTDTIVQVSQAASAPILPQTNRAGETHNANTDAGCKTEAHKTAKSLQGPAEYSVSCGASRGGLTSMYRR